MVKYGYILQTGSSEWAPQLETLSKKIEGWQIFNHGMPSTEVGSWQETIETLTKRAF